MKKLIKKVQLPNIIRKLNKKNHKYETKDTNEAKILKSKPSLDLGIQSNQKSLAYNKTLIVENKDKSDNISSLIGKPLTLKKIFLLKLKTQFYELYKKFINISNSFQFLITKWNKKLKFLHKRTISSSSK